MPTRADRTPERPSPLRRFWVFVPPGGEPLGPSRKKYRYLNAVFFLCLGMMALYLAWFPLVYRDARFDVALGAQVGLLALAPLLHRAARSYEVTAWFVGLVGSLTIVFHAFIAGGFASPGVFWLFAIPLTLGILVRRPGVVVGGALVILTIAWLALVGPYPGFHDFLASREGFQREVLFNMTTFAVYALVTTDVFVSSEDAALAALGAQKSEIDSLLRVVVHDIASPLTVARTEIALLKEDLPPNADADDALGRVDVAIDSAAAIISGVRSVRALKDGKLGLAREVVDLAAAVGEVVRRFDRLARDKGVRLELEVAQGADARVVTDAFVLKSIVLPNLLSNALKFTPEARRIGVGVGVRDGVGVVRVRDEGIGIPAALQEKLFAFDAPTTRAGTRGERGTGYGLPVVHEVLETMGGAIAITSSVDPGASGTEVEVTLPLAS